MVTDAEQAASDERKRAAADTKVRMDEVTIGRVTTVRHVRPDREDAPDPPAEE